MELVSLLLLMLCTHGRDQYIWEKKLWLNCMKFLTGDQRHREFTEGHSQWHGGENDR